MSQVIWNALPEVDFEEAASVFTTLVWNVIEAAGGYGRAGNDQQINACVIVSNVS